MRENKPSYYKASGIGINYITKIGDKAINENPSLTITNHWQLQKYEKN